MVKCCVAMCSASLLVPDQGETVDQGEMAKWSLVERSGKRTAVNLNEQTALNYAKTAADAFVVGRSRQLSFNKELAQKDAKKKTKAA